jgi:hypothetical protein
MVLKSLYNSLSWTNKRRIDKWAERYNTTKKWLTPKAKKVVSEIPKLPKKEKTVDIETELFPENHNYIGYRIEKHTSGDKIHLIEKPPHPKECICKECMDALGNEIMDRRKVMTDESE